MGALRPLKFDDTNSRTTGRSEESKKQFIAEAKETIKQLYNTVSVSTWTVFNEGWGQFDSLKVCDELRQLDSTRLFDNASGWVDTGKGDYSSHHIYFRKIRLTNDNKRVLALTEFGGYSYKAEPDRKGKVFGYSLYKDKEKLEKAKAELDSAKQKLDDGRRELDSARSELDRAARESGSAVAGVPSKDTVRITDDEGYGLSTPARKNVWIVQTPQVFRLEDLLPAHSMAVQSLEKLEAEGIQITDDAMVAETMLGIKAQMVMASYNNIKVTTQEDLPLAEAILKGQSFR
jgi:hypothetical protein